jgi:hypothetical protein
METRDSEKKRPDDGQVCGDAVTPRMGDRLMATYCKTTACSLPSLLLFTWARNGLGTAKTGKRLVSYSGGCRGFDASDVPVQVCSSVGSPAQMNN